MAKDFYTDIDLKNNSINHAVIENGQLVDVTIADAQEGDFIRVDSQGNLVPDQLVLTTDETISSGTSISVLEPGHNYTFSSSIASLTISDIDDGDMESNVFFTVSGSSFAVTLPNGVKCIGEVPEFENGDEYVMSYYRNTVVFGKIGTL